MSANVLWKILIFSTVLNIIKSFEQSKNFSNCDTSKHFSHKNRAGRVKILICAGEKNRVPQWQYTDGSSTLGEVFNPARDCSDIVDHLPGAEDGFYWILSDDKSEHQVKQVWCDVHTDGGGFMLVGMKDSPVSWTVPSNSTPVDPQGPPHWSSVLGDSEILDFGIQFSSNNTFQGTEAHWLYRMKQKRQLGNLFTNDKSKGCATNSPGIGDVLYVKDILTGTVTTNNFECSIFGPHTHSSLGWARMNYCLRHTCKNGYGVIPGPFVFKYTQYGSFSYSAMSTSSGMVRNSTAFVGCDNGKCCACFGPKGGKQNYCGEKCTAINGGRIMKKVVVWFWVRSRMPERLWKKCMEFMKRNFAGELEKHFIDPKTGTAHKGSCSEQFKTFLNEGTLTVADKGSFQKVPEVPGLLSYREDNKQLYVNQGSHNWQALGTQQEVQQLKKEQKSEIETLKEELWNKTDKALASQVNKLKELESKVKSQQTNVSILEQQIKNQGRKIQTQDNKIQTQDKRIQTQDNKIQTQEKKIQTQANETYSQQIKFQTQDNKIQTQEKKIQTQEKKIQTQEKKIQTQEKKIQTQENENQNQINETRSQKIKIESLEIKYQGAIKLLKKEQKSDIKKLKKELSNKTDKALTSLDNELKALESKVKSQQTNASILQQQIKSQEKKIQNQEKKIQTQENENQNQNNKVRSQKIKIESLENKYQGIVNRMDKLHPPTSCSSLLIKQPSTPSGMHYIKLQGLSSSPLVKVYCDMTSKNGVGVTVIGHDSESRTLVKGYEKSGSYNRTINYNLPMKQMVAIIKQSQWCEQFIRYECHGSNLRLDLSSHNGWWVSRVGSKMNYWGGADVDSGQCACAKDSSCAGGRTCNCDKNDATLREDSGYLKDKSTLPVTELRFGDTGGGDINEYGYHTLGKLRCWG